MSSSGYERLTDAGEVLGIIPSWMQLELRYANAKHKGKNPQLDAFEGGLKGGRSYQDIAQYLGRFNVFYAQADGDKHLLLQASQQLGKFVGTGRALVSAVFQRSIGYDRDTADHESISRLSNRLNNHKASLELVRTFKPTDGLLVSEDQYKPLIGAVNEAIEAARPSRQLQTAEALLDTQALAFAAFSLRERLMAAPGFPSGEVYEWEAAKALDIATVW